jgi:AcrR family transcriptional regulator
MAGRTRRRADAERNIAAILDAAVDRFATSPDASMTDIARAAGVGRMTLYGHFPTRDELRQAALGHVIDQVQTAFDGLDLDRLPPRDALAAMLRASWHMIERHRAFFATAVHHHEPAFHHHHEHVFARLDEVITRGQADGSFRSGQPVAWLAAACVGLVHAAVTQVESGRMTADDAVEALVATVLRAL